MESQSPLFQIEVHSLLHSSGNLFRRTWVLKVNLSTAFHPQTNGLSRAHYSDLRGYVEGLCNRFQRELG
uniref:Putative ovule protein n=1 Tax=Solanum chacoense TaxID=4108 RepID=A0A0V0GN92_SOLCH